MIEPSNSIKTINNRLEEKKKISDLEDRTRETKKEKKRNIGNLWDLCTYFSFEVLNTNGVPEGREKEKSRKLI